MVASLVLTLVLSGFIGFALGIFGGGGSILAVPVLVYVARVAPVPAAGMSLAIVGTTSLTASYAHHKRGHVCPEVALLFGGAGIVTAFFGARLTRFVPDPILMLAFAALMVSVGAGMFVRRAGAEVSGEDIVRSPRRLRAAISGAVVGAVTGFLGVGGGFLVVPALVAFAGLRMREAVGTSLLVIAMNSAAGFVGHLGRVHLDATLVAELTLAAVVGTWAGTHVSRHISVNRLRRVFALFVVVVGAAVAISTGTNLLSPRWG